MSLQNTAVQTYMIIVLLILTLQDPQECKKVCFKFFNVWTEHEYFLKIVETEWKKTHGHSKMKEIWVKLKNLQPVLRHLNNTEFKGISQNIDQARQELNRVQNQMSINVTDELIAQERNTLIKLKRWSMIKENALRQKSRTKWIQLGDSNT